MMPQELWDIVFISNFFLQKVFKYLSSVKIALSTFVFYERESGCAHISEIVNSFTETHIHVQMFQEKENGYFF